MNEIDYVFYFSTVMILSSCFLFFFFISVPTNLTPNNSVTTATAYNFKVFRSPAVGKTEEALMVSDSIWVLSFKLFSVE